MQRGLHWLGLPALALAIALSLGSAGCATSTSREGVLAINLATGETRAFPDEGSVPPGWVVCPDRMCPPPLACEGLEEAACLARADCFPVYVELWPAECESASPPAYCATLPYVGCQALPTTPPDGGVCTSPEPPCGSDCPPGTHSPTDEHGCVTSCTCVPDEPLPPTCPDCLPMCVEGSHQPIGPDGCALCTCVPDDPTSPPVCEPGCRFACPEGTHNPITSAGCLDTCACAPD